MPIPALLTTMSSFPNARVVSATTRCQSCSLPTSCSRKIAWPPARSILARTASPGFALTSVSATAAPSRANSAAHAWPIPIAPPVMSATFPCTRFIVPFPRPRSRAPLIPHLLPCGSFPLPLEIPATRPARIARARQMPVRLTPRHRSAQPLTRCTARRTADARVRDGFRVPLRLDVQLGEERARTRLAHVLDEARNESLDEHEALAGREGSGALDEISNRGAIEPGVEWALVRVDDSHRSVLARGQSGSCRSDDDAIASRQDWCWPRKGQITTLVRACRQ